tara:strand:+ start:5375 stop:5563 length:189 start_codon:yes stop_codon:yes gene_type:complete
MFSGETVKDINDNYYHLNTYRMQTFVFIRKQIYFICIQLYYSIYKTDLQLVSQLKRYCRRKE